MGRTIGTRDGLALHRRDWPSADARGTIVIVHGLGEHVGRYAHVAARLNASGWSVVGYDQRGHGASPGEVAIAWTLTNPAVTAAIVGVRNAQQAQGVAGAANLALTQDEIVEITDDFVPEAA